MKVIRFFAPQVLFGFLGAFVGVANAAVKAWGSTGEFWTGVLDGRGALPAARIGPEILVIFIGVLFAVLLIGLFTLTLNGLVAGFVGWLGGVVAGGLYDVIILRGGVIGMARFFLGKRGA